MLSERESCFFCHCKRLSSLSANLLIILAITHNRSVCKTSENSRKHTAQYLSWLFCWFLDQRPNKSSKFWHLRIQHHQIFGIFAWKITYFRAAIISWLTNKSIERKILLFCTFFHLCWFRSLLFFVSYDSKWRVCGFWTVCGTNEALCTGDEHLFWHFMDYKINGFLMKIISK